MKWWIFVFVLILVVPFVFAEENGCCGQSFAGDTCVYTVESNCASTPDYFAAGASCEGRPWCGTGCCVTSEGSCADGSGYYSCEIAEGEYYYADQSCEGVSGCAKTCCQLDSDYTYITEAACAYASAATGIEAVYLGVDTESECYDLERAEESGCCVSDVDCVASSFEACEYSDLDASVRNSEFLKVLSLDISSPYLIAVLDSGQSRYEKPQLINAPFDPDNWLRLNVFNGIVKSAEYF